MRLKGSAMISFDLETYRITTNVIAPKPVIASFHDGKEVTLLRFPEAWDRIEQMLDSDEVVCGANIAFDFGVCAVHRPKLLSRIFKKYQEGKVYDILIAGFLDLVSRGEAPSKEKVIRVCGNTYTAMNLEMCAGYYLQVPNAKENDEYRLRYGELDAIPFEQWPETARIYPADDAIHTYNVAHTLQLSGQNQGPIQGRTTTHPTLHARAAFSMQLGSIYGMRTDQTYIEKLTDIYQKEFLKQRLEWKEKGLVREDMKDNAALIKELVILAYNNDIRPGPCSTCCGTGKVPGKAKGKNPKPVNCKDCSATGLEIPKGVPRTATGGVSGDADTMMESGNDTLEAFYQTSKMKKPIQTYLPFVTGGGKYSVHVSPNAIVETGRSSYKGPIQQIPRNGGIREAFVADPGHVLCSNDYSALELCALAQVCINLFGESVMGELINKDVDLHSYFGAKLLNISFEEFMLRKDKKDKTVAAFRQGAKAINFGLPGGMGVAKFIKTQRKDNVRFCTLFGQAETCGVSKVIEYNDQTITPTCEKCIEIVSDLKKQWFQTFPEVQKYLKWVSKQEDIKENRGVLQAIGTGFIRGGLGYADMANTNFQHLAALGAKTALWNVTQEMYLDRTSPMYGGKVLVFVHDENLSMFREERAHEAANRQGKVMEESMSEFIKDVKIFAPPATMTRWFKAADKVMENGRLVPWMPKKDRPIPKDPFQAAIDNLLQVRLYNEHRQTEGTK
jgi:DNA polymerase-1